MAQMAQNDIIGLILKCFDDGTQSVPAQNDEKRLNIQHPSIAWLKELRELDLVFEVFRPNADV